MANRNELAAYTSSLVNMSEYAELQERLKLYQVFQSSMNITVGCWMRFWIWKTQAAPQ